jgi:two-component system, chemotaxis family, chemotaxis protein CheY
MPSQSASTRVGARYVALLVDPNDDTRGMYGEILRLSGWTTDEATDGREALAKAITRRPDIVLTETRLPGISGYDLCGLLRRDSATRDVPIIVITADARPGDVQRAHDAGADLVLVKPCLPEQVASEAARIMRHSRGPDGGANDDGDRILIAVGGARMPDRAGARDPKRQVLSRAHRRHDTTTPPIAPPALVCPNCDEPLIYKRSHVGGVSARHPEQWDYFDCANGCGTFQYRERTRKLRRVL